MVADSSWSPSMSAPESVSRRLVQHHKAMIGFLFGFFLVVGLYSTVSGQFGSTNTIAAVLQSAPTAEHSDKNTTASSPGASMSSPPASAPKNSTQGAVHDVDNGQNVDATKKTGDQRLQDNVHGSDSINNKTSANFTVNLDNLQANRTDKSGQTVNTASDKQEEEIIRQELDLDGDTNERNTRHGAPRKPICDLSDPRYDVCDMSGDARAIGGPNRTVLYISGDAAGAEEGHEWAIRDQSRKHLEYINTVAVKSLSAAQAQAQSAPECTSRHAVPAVVFAMNGLTSNPWHDFSDVLIPLFITARGFDGGVQFLVTDIQPWFLDKYRLILANLSRHDIVDLDKESGSVRCHPRVIVGLRSHRDLGIDPARFPAGNKNYTMLDFRMYIRELFSLPPASVDIPYKEQSAAAAAEKQRKKPRLMLINRGRNRKFVNLPEIAAAAEAAGFETVVVEPRRDLKLEEFSRVVDSCDVLMGAHGAGLTNFFFLRTGAVMLQVVPWGHMERPSMEFYGVPAKEMRLRDVEYSITAEESTLYEKYGKDHPAVRDPESIHRQGWQLGMRYYWLEQDIRLNVTRFAPTLHQVLRTIRG
ncbi:uncharacterized protein LOC100840829 isoform X1 [Brachypodium distachyon]|uniref:Xylan arabinosyl 2-O-xylosyltransferase 1 n=1 Tax=Brachypodium distachyon TaxID=15368 RepID=A0A0Q3F407_BRADI|nr:uncharacterized protein LOC100840829 isoform X1 [Brachypodium distachyon]KQJ94311.1 hypothetical protein BRADI_3g09797v3 [Brachypodium distachyon]UVC67028.1 xylan arabinosyl 2-O-xylosyltransferase 1 [Brachypodium distachyon]|eukprot:XP_010234118.1 uncharacterized protein LOC100840829 isoform X1 [Brachypodium distachyon]